MASSKPLPKEVVVSLKTLSEDKAKQLFYHLDLPIETLTNIEAKHSGGMLTIRCVHEWINSDLEASWGKIVAGLREIGMNQLAQELATKHHVETPPSVLTSNPPVSAQDSDGTQSSVTSVQPLTSEISSDHPVKVTSASTSSTPVQPVTPEVSFTPSMTKSAPNTAVQPLISVVSSNFAASVTTESASSTPDPPEASTAHPTTCSTDPIENAKKEIKHLQDTFTDVIADT